MKERVNTNPHILQFVLKQNKKIPNNKLPVLIYQSALDLPNQKNKSSEIIQKIFVRNGWSNSWRNGIYDFHHYHSITHECMAIASGWATVILGGPKGKKIKLSQGDVVIIPAGVAHKCVKFSESFQCVGAYRREKTMISIPEQIRNMQRLSSILKSFLFPLKTLYSANWDF